MIFAADNSADMLAIAEAAQPLEVVKRVETFQTSAFAIDMGDNAVDSIFCMRLLHHIADPAHRLAMLREFHRVTRDTLIVSLWVDGNYKAWKRRRLERRPARQPEPLRGRPFGDRGGVRRGRFRHPRPQRFPPGYAMWRVYVLRKRVEHEPSLRTAGPRGADQHLSALVGHAWRVGRGAQPATRRRKRRAADSPARSAAVAATASARSAICTARRCIRSAGPRCCACHALQALRDLGVRVPELIYCGTRQQAGQWQALLVTAELQGFVSLEDWYDEGMPGYYGSVVQARMLDAVGRTLGRLHHARWQHGCCYPKHIFLRVHGQDDGAQVEVALLDLEKSRRRLRRHAAARHDLRQLRRHCTAMSEPDWQRLLTAHAGYREVRCDVA